MASKEAVLNRRLNRWAAKQHKSRAITDLRPVVVVPSIVRSGLTDREQLILRDATEPLFASGRIDLRYMGIAFLELHHLRWTPPFLKNDLCVEHLPPEERQAWADEEFTLVWEWWSRQPPETRLDVISESRSGHGV